MASYSRHIKGDRDPIQVEVRDNVTVEQGDFMFVNDTNGIAGPTKTTLHAADNRAYPFSYLKPSTAGPTFEYYAINNFLGVAETAHPAGAGTVAITINTGGVYRYPLYAGILSAVTVGSLVSAVSPATSGGNTGVSNQTVVNHATQSGKGTTAYLGYCVKTESGASFVDFRIRTKINQGVAS